jgi:hypothetical protein
MREFDSSGYWWGKVGEVDPRCEIAINKGIPYSSGNKAEVQGWVVVERRPLHLKAELRII